MGVGVAQSMIEPPEPPEERRASVQFVPAVEDDQWLGPGGPFPLVGIPLVGCVIFPMVVG